MFLYQRPLTIEEHAAIYVGGLFIVLRLLGAHFESLRVQMDQQTWLGLALIVTGLMSLAKYPTLHRIAQVLGVRSHDTLRNTFLGSGWKVAVIMAALVQFALLQATGLPGNWGILILDDVIIPKRYAKYLPYVYWDYDHVTKRKLRCLRVVMLVWTNGLLKIPVGFKIWHKKGSAYWESQKESYKTKHDWARELLVAAQQAHIPFEYLAFDSWYASKEHIRWLCEQQILFVTVLPCNTKVRLIDKPPAAPKGSRGNRRWYRCEQLETVFPPHTTSHRYAGLQARARKISVRYGHKSAELALVAIWHFRHEPELVEQAQQEAQKPRKKRHPHLYILTNMTTLPVAEIVRRYRRRWDIEVLFRDLKQHLGVGACVVRQAEAGEKHLALCLLSYVGLELLRQECHQVTGRELSSITIGEVKADLARALVVVTPEGEVHQVTPGRVEPLPKSLFPALQTAFAEPDGTGIAS
jgi:hypothetical protein